jgi:hypothetical protein
VDVGEVRSPQTRGCSSKTWLAVYLSINEFGIRQHETEQAIAEIKDRHAASFDRAFVIWKNKLL